MKPAGSICVPYIFCGRPTSLLDSTCVWSMVCTAITIFQDDNVSYMSCKGEFCFVVLEWYKQQYFSSESGFLVDVFSKKKEKKKANGNRFSRCLSFRD